MPEVILFMILGGLAGVLINYLADVLPLRKGLIQPECLQCEEKQDWVHYILWPRLCPTCGKRRGLRVWVVEIFSILAGAWLAIESPGRLPPVISLVLLTYFGLVIVIDMEHHLILHNSSRFGAVLGVGIGWWLHGPVDTITGGVAGFGLMFGLYILGVVLVRTVGRWRGADPDGEAIGFGDVVLSGVLGLILGWPGITAGLIIAILLSGAISLLYIVIMLIARRYRTNLAIPYGPFLVIGAFILLFLPQLLLRN